MQTELVDRRRWISSNHFLQILNYCMLLPGPEAMQLATYVGWLLHRIPGGLMAGAFFVIPSIFIMLGITYIYAAYGSVSWIAALFYGLKPAVLAIVASATISIGSKALRHPIKYLIATASFAALFFFKVSFPLVILSAALAGLIGVRLFPKIGAVGLNRVNPPRNLFHYLSVSSLPWATPASDRHLSGLLACSLGGLGTVAGSERRPLPGRTLFQQGRHSHFGGAYSVLPYVAQQAVDYFHWLTPAQMIDGLGLAETLPGPLIKVLQFVGFMAGWHQARDLASGGPSWEPSPPPTSPLCPAFCGFFWEPLTSKRSGQPDPKRGHGRHHRGGGGRVLNLAVWFGLNVLVPANHGIDWFALG